MSSLRGSPRACFKAPVAALALSSRRASLWAALSLVGCSSAANLDDAQGSATEGETLAGFASGETEWGPEGDSAGGTGSTSNASGPATSGTSGDSDPGSTSTTGAEPLPPPDEAPHPVDELSPQNLPDDNEECGGGPVVWRLAARDAAAMTSPAHAREAMLGPWPSLTGVPIRPWEFLNYYTFAYPLAPPGQLLTAAQLRAGQDDLGDMFDLQVAVRGPELAEADRSPVHLTLALDNSGSMEGKALELLKSASHVLSSKLRAGDTVAAVSWNQADPVLLKPMMVAGPNDPKLAAAIDGFTVGGSAELTDALSAGYTLAEQQYVPKDINRLIVISDGGATATPENLAEIAKRAGDVPGKTGIHVIGLGVGDPALYRRDLIDAVGEAGAGPSIYIGSPEEAERQLGARFLALVGLTASSVEVRLTLPPGLRLEVEQKADLEVLPQDHVTAAPTDRTVIHRRLRPCSDDLDLAGAIQVEVDWIDAVTGEPKKVTSEWKLSVLLSGDTAWLEKGAAVLAYAAALQATQYLPGDLSAVDEAWVRLNAAKAALPGDPELAEIGEVLAALQQP